MVAPACTIRRITARPAALAVLLTIAPMPVLAGGVCQDAGDRAMSAGAGRGNEAGPQGPVTLRVGEQSSATFQAYGGAALVIRPPAPADAGEPDSAAAASVQPQIIYAPGTPSRTNGRPIVRTLASAGLETAAVQSAPAAAAARPAPAIIQPAIVYAPGARPRPASPGPGLAGPLDIGQLQLSSEDCDALARVAYAEAANQGPEGLAAVA
ncbi:MAG: hypothetical protein U1E53_18845, partial [Dongiaceae bacterium]